MVSVGQNETWIGAVPPALIVWEAGEAAMLKSTTFTSGCVMVGPTGPPFALALPETAIVLLRTGIDGVMSTSTFATSFTARAPKLQENTAPGRGQLPEPPLTILAEGVDANPVLGHPKAKKVTRLALSVPMLVISNVKATCIPALTGFGNGLTGLVDTVTVTSLLAPSWLTKASVAELVGHGGAGAVLLRHCWKEAAMIELGMKSVESVVPAT